MHCAHEKRTEIRTPFISNWIDSTRSCVPNRWLGQTAQCSSDKMTQMKVKHEIKFTRIPEEHNFFYCFRCCFPKRIRQRRRTMRFLFENVIRDVLPFRRSSCAHVWYANRFIVRWFRVIKKAHSIVHIIHQMGGVDQTPRKCIEHIEGHKWIYCDSSIYWDQRARAYGNRHTRFACMICCARNLTWSSARHLDFETWELCVWAFLGADSVARYCKSILMATTGSLGEDFFFSLSIQKVCGAYARIVWVLWRLIGGHKFNNFKKIYLQINYQLQMGPNARDEFIIIISCFPFVAHSMRHDFISWNLSELNVWPTVLRSVQLPPNAENRTKMALRGCL